MNKYQEALDIVKKCNCIDCTCTAIDTLQELVDRATPKKPIKDVPSKLIYEQTYVCPNCGRRFSGRISKFCYRCGQALDWRDE